MRRSGRDFPGDLVKYSGFVFLGIAIEIRTRLWHIHRHEHRALYCLRV